MMDANENATGEHPETLSEALGLDERVRRHPYGMLAAAFGIGYVLGGGLDSPLTTGIVRTALRLALRASALPFVENELAALLAGRGRRRSGDEHE